MRGRIFHSKKASLEIQFNWIFVTVVGIILFLFIIGIGYKQRSNAENMLGQELAGKLATSIITRQQSSASFTEISISSANILFSCDPASGIYEFKVGKSQYVTMPIAIAFSDRNINSGKLQVWTQDFNMPFLITTFSYITTPNTAYIFYNDSTNLQAAALAKRVYNEMPANISKFIADDARIQVLKNSYPRTKIICFSNNCPSGNHLIIEPTADVFSVGNLRFSNGQSKYASKAALYGAIFANDKGFYECQMDRALYALNVKKKVLLNRLQILEKEYQVGGSICYSAIASPKSILTNMNDVRVSNIDAIYSASINLENANRDLEFRGCPSVY